MRHPEHIEAILQKGAAKAREVSAPFLARIKRAVGIAALG
jgi:tryptophanyl-tRNA synthetase